ncbi:MAG: 2-succinyl-5-enolpyruvyl-6-hydroxy-3-cyclohexene-1-carboxylic-acid synthase [Lachnospiraceae bacterium]
MYSKIKSVQYLLALMKAHDIKHVVLSPGGRNIPIAHSMEQDEFFDCYSVVDERSAAYFAIGLAQQFNEPVAICCTSSVAASNYLPGITEAFYLKVPILVLTADRNPYLLDQMENQMIDQVDMFKNFCKLCVQLPIVTTADDEWYCQRKINEAILELKHHGCGPVQIDIPIAGEIGMYTQETLPPVKVIRRLEYKRNENEWKDKITELKNANKILVVCGEQIYPSKQLSEAILKFAKKYNCVIATEKVSNIEGPGVLDIFGAAQVMPVDVFEEYVPDIVISFGGNFVSRIKDLLRVRHANCSHWVIDEGGSICDVFKCLTTIYECTPLEFFDFFATNTGLTMSNNKKYYDKWADYVKKAEYPDFPYSNSYVIKELSKRIPSDSLMHLGILNATRIMSHCKTSENITSYSNIGAFGIDGSMSTFIGQSVAAPDKLAFLVIGDLSFFYDMNALQIRHLGKNVRIMLVNNSGAAEFHFFMGEKLIPTLNRHIAAEHFTSAEGWVKTKGFTYLAAHNQEEFDANIEKFVVAKSDAPIFLEVFTDKKSDAEMLKDYYAKFKTQKKNDVVKDTIKKIFKSGE